MFLVLGAVLSLINFLPSSTGGTQTATIIDDNFTLTPNETYRQGLGSFHGNENITLNVDSNSSAVNFTLLNLYWTTLHQLRILRLVLLISRRSRLLRSSISSGFNGIDNGPLSSVG